MMSWETWQFAFSVTVPNLLMLLMGIGLRRFRLINDEFCDSASRLVFNLALPCMLFFSIATNHSGLTHHLLLMSFAGVGTFISWLLLELAAPFLVREKKERGVFVQGGFRGNAAILGVAYCAMAFGDEGVAIASFYIVMTVILYNVLSVVTLTRSLSDCEGSGLAVFSMVKNIVKNPLIVGILTGLPFSLFDVPLPDVLIRTGSYVSSIALPLALLCTGASLDFRSMLRTSNTAILASIARVLVVPTLLVLGAMLCGFKGMTLGIIFLLSATPTAAASYVMTRAMGGNATLAANIIGLTTVGSFFTTALGLLLLRGSGMI
ncbi:transporter [Leminorella grimontii]|uniref:Transporter n=2 Tax=Leminorella grimontii TaxID=82981 RepID=A0AAV5MZ70_9GAMM|nr:putative AEC family malate permease [Leminorella grimontii ATCC 33999 = DSM 5078]GKX55138.1 transporter [Leminorella grimontii]GKX58563.1 transporter [Leminorella grimontii]VFS56844.1 auxin efflux carrier [Leminorella grimontii]